MATIKYVTASQFDVFLKEETEHHTRVDGDIAQLRSDVSTIRKTLFGNGVRGWDEILRDIERYMDRQEQKEKDTKGEVLKYVYWGITFVVSQLVGFGSALLLMRLGG